MEPNAGAGNEPLLLEREGELAALRDAFDRLAEGQGSMLLVEGAAGIGKTTLLRGAAGLGAGRSVPRSRGRAGQLEREVPFGVPASCSEPLIERAERPNAPVALGQRRPSLIALGRGEIPTADAEVDPFAPIHGLYWLVANLCDAGRCCSLSTTPTGRTANRFAGSTILARRVATPPCWSRRRAHRRGRRARRAGAAAARRGRGPPPGPAQPRGGRRADRRRARRRPVGRVLGRVQQATGGNPFLLAEVLRTLRSRSVAPDARGRQRARLAGPGAGRPLGPPRLHRFGDEAVSMARAIAVLGGARRSAILRARPDRRGRARELCGRLREAELLAPGQPIDFVHPLIRTAIYLRALRGGALRGPSAGRGADQRDRRRRPRARTAPHGLRPEWGPWVVDRLREAAREAIAAGAPDSARRYLERALEEPAPTSWGDLRARARAMGGQPARGPGGPRLGRRAHRGPGATPASARGCRLDLLRRRNLERAVHWFGRLVEAIPADRPDQTLPAEASLYVPERAERRSPPGGPRRGSRRSWPRRARPRGASSWPPGALLRPLPGAAPRSRRSSSSPRPSRPALGRPGAVPGSPPRCWPGAGVGRAREATAGLGERALGRLVHVASYRESLLGGDRPPRGEPRRLRGGGAHRVGHRPRPPGVAAGLGGDRDLLATLIARGAAGGGQASSAAAGTSRRRSARCRCPPCRSRSGAHCAWLGASSRAGAEDLLAVGEDLERWAAEPGRGPLAPRGRRRAGRARSHRRGGADRRRRRGAGSRRSAPLM